VLVTGANSGIGLASVLELARRGFDAVGSVRSPAKARQVQQAARDAGVKVRTVQLDVSRAADCARVIARLRPFGLVNNAGYPASGAVEDVRDDEALAALIGWGLDRLVGLARENGTQELQIQIGVSQVLILIAFMFSFVLAMTAAFIGAPAIGGDLESGIAFAILARPLRRVAFADGAATNPRARLRRAGDSRAGGDTAGRSGLRRAEQYSRHRHRQFISRPARAAGAHGAADDVNSMIPKSGNRFSDKIMLI